MRPNPAQLSLFDLGDLGDLGAPRGHERGRVALVPAVMPPPPSPPAVDATPLPGRLWSDVWHAEATLWRAAGYGEKADALDRRADGMGSHRVQDRPPVLRMDKRPKLMFRRVDAGPCQLEVWAINPETEGWRCVRTVRPSSAADESLSVVELLLAFPGLHVCERSNRVLTSQGVSATVGP